MISTGLYTVSSVHLEPSTLCQAMCSRCPRTLHHNKLPSSKNVSFKDFERHLLPYYQSGELQHLTLCGNYGDPMMNPDVASIAISVANLFDDPLHVTLNTNGGIGKPDHYYEMARAGVRMAMSLEGMNQSSHERYRQNVDFSKLMENIEAVKEGYIAGGYPKFSGILHYYVIPWAHTIAEIRDIVEFARETGGFIDIPYPRHNPGGHPSFDIKGKLVDVLTLNENTLNFKFGRFSETPEGDWLRSFDELLDYDWGEEIAVVKNQGALSLYGRKHIEYNPKNVFERVPNLEIYNHYDESVSVNCKAQKQTNLYVSCDLLVYPCCHIATHVDGQLQQIVAFADDVRFRPLIENFYRTGGVEAYSLTNRTLEEITNDDQWRNFSFNHLNGTKVLNYCEHICGKCS